MTNQSETYNEKLATRLSEIINILGLSISGFAEFIGRDSSHIYGILNLTRPFSDTFAEHIGKKLNIKGAKIINLNVPIPPSISKSESILEFKKAYKGNWEYFANTKADRSADFFISEVLIKSKFLKTPRYLSEIELFISSNYNKIFIDDQLSKALRYSVKKGTLKQEKRPIKLKNGNIGKRLVDVYWID